VLHKFYIALSVVVNISAGHSHQNLIIMKIIETFTNWLKRIQEKSDVERNRAVAETNINIRCKIDENGDAQLYYDIFGVILKPEQLNISVKAGDTLEYLRNSFVNHK
jgi:hypothetical protein